MVALLAALVAVLLLVDPAEAVKVGDRVKTSGPDTTRTSPNSLLPPLSDIPAESAGMVTGGPSADQSGATPYIYWRINFDNPALADGWITDAGLVVLPPIPGGLTSTEKTSVQQVVWAAASGKPQDAGSVHDGIASVLGYITRDKTKTKDQRAAITQLWRLSRQAQNDLALALLDLLGSNLEPTSQPRSYYVQRAIAKIDSVQNTILPQLLAAADKAKAVGADGAYPATIDRYKSINIQGAINKLKAFNRTLKYTDPYPPGRSPTGRITIIGPHGDYVRAQTWFTHGFDRMHRMWTAQIDGYYGNNTEAFLPSYENVYQGMKFSSLLIQKMFWSSGYIAGIKIPGYPENPFFATLRVQENMLHAGGGPTTEANDCAGDFCHAMAYDFHTMMIFTQSDIPQWTGRPIFQSNALKTMAELTQSWQATDTAAWYFLKFPECDQVNNPVGCGGTRSYPNTTLDNIPPGTPFPYEDYSGRRQ